MDTPFQTCVTRNDERTTDGRVPYSSLVAFAQLLLQSPPQPNEGFAEVLRVIPSERGSECGRTVPDPEGLPTVDGRSDAR